VSRFGGVGGVRSNTGRRYWFYFPAIRADEANVETPASTWIIQWDLQLLAWRYAGRTVLSKMRFCVKFMTEAVSASEHGQRSAMAMKTSRIFTALLGALLISGVCSGTDSVEKKAVDHPPFAQKIHIPGVSDAGKVNDYLYRGTQPGEKGLKHLQKLGIDTIVDLRGEFPWEVKKEGSRAEKLGMRVVSIPGNGWSPPKDEQVAEFFALLQQQPRHKIYIHCWLGGDRSGVFLAAYRIAFDGWTPEQALAEMHQFRFHGFWHPAMTEYIRDFPEHMKHSEMLARYRRSESTASKVAPSARGRTVLTIVPAN
jgi:tyrosine-protein phosphatase SIW14